MLLFFRHLKGVIGSNYWNSTNIIKFSGHKIHPKYGWANMANDIALLRTAEEIVFNALVRSIAMKYEFVGGGVTGSVTGWGQLWVRITMSILLVEYSLGI